MPSFTTDRDLLTLEPNLFRDIAWSAQTLAKGSGTLASGDLAIDSIDLAARGITVGMVAVVNGLALEITGFTNPTHAQVSLLRDDTSAPRRLPPDAAAVPASIATFSPQISLVHANLLRSLGLERSGATPPPGVDPVPFLTEDRITNRPDLARIESLGALQLIYSAASALLGPDSTPGERARVYADRFARERFRAAAQVDTNGDTRPDALRRFNVLHLVRT